MDDWRIWLPWAVLFLGMSFGFWLVSAWIRAIARAEVNKALKGYIAGHLLRPRNNKGQFRGK
jgi:hypothetical protein